MRRHVNRFGFAGLSFLLIEIWITTGTNAQDEFTDSVLDPSNRVRLKAFLGLYLTLEKGGDVTEEIGLTRDQTNRIAHAIESYYVAEDNLEKQVFEIIKLPEDEQLSASDANSNQLKELAIVNRVALLEILTTTQRKRLAQVIFQNHVVNSRWLSIYTHPFVMQAIGLTEKQTAEIVKATEKARAEYLREYVDLNNKYRDRVLDAVNADSRRKVDKQVGEVWFPFKIPNATKASDNSRRKD